MPLYEYQCSQCARPFEKYARTFNDQPDCPSCGAADVTRLLSTFAVSTGSDTRPRDPQPSFGGCGEGPPCGASQCGRLDN
ncbi:MAG: zinc ribbon domain-containing protein [Vicinamibacteria bacterium]|nr:zinc ribbon domain-containing protein [Vicinamibacteria bacterium]